MRAMEVMNGFVVRARPDSTVRDVAAAMRDQGVGIVCVCNEDKIPLGVVTDRDLALRVCATGANPNQLLIQAVMSKNPITCALDAEVEDIHLLMNQNGVARVFVVDAARQVSGIVTLAELWHYESPLEAGPVSRRVTQRELRVHSVSRGVAVESVTSPVTPLDHEWAESITH
jgi:CBS domain-containing protein